MKMQEVVATSSARTREAIQGVARYARLERVLAILCAFTPVLLILADWLTDEPGVRESISAYHNVGHPEAFYMPLTAAAMLFLVNGVVKEGQLYNVFLGGALAGLVLVDTDGWTAIHVAFAAVFFVGNVAVMGFWTSVRGWKVRGPLIAVVALAMAGWFAFGWFTLFVAEWISLAIIAAHFVIESFVDDEDAIAGAQPVPA